MELSTDICNRFFSSLSDQVAILDESGNICAVNDAWLSYSKENGGDPHQTGVGINYFNICNTADINSNADAARVLAGIKQIRENRSSSFSYEYPCHSPTEKAWYEMTCRPFAVGKKVYITVLHHDITPAVLLREKFQLQALTDSLTNIPNRRHYEQFFEQEWRRNMRSGSELSLIMIDVDHFKDFNDRYGHITGDECLKSIGLVLQEFGRRPSDLAARIGGEEFVVVLGGTPNRDALKIAQRMRESIWQLNIQHEGSTEYSRVTASIGVASLKPQWGLSPEPLLDLVDRALYSAKNSGRNTVVNSIDLLQ